MNSIVSFAEAIIQVSPLNLKKLEQIFRLNMNVGGDELNLATDDSGYSLNAA